MKFAFEVKVIVAFLTTAVVVVALAMISWRVADDASHTAYRVAQTQAMLYDLARTRADTLQIELATQGFRLSGDASQLAERDLAVADREAALEEIAQLIEHSPQQQLNLVALRASVQQRLAISQRVERLRSTQGQAAADAYVAEAPLRQTRARTYQLLDDMTELERQALSDREAAHAKARRVLVVSGGLAAVFLIMLLLGTYLLIRRQFRETDSAQQALATSEESLSVTLHSIGDAMLATDIQGRVTRMNTVAEQLTGWPAAEALGRPIEQVFRIVHEQTREPAAIPVSEVLATGQAHDLAADTALIRRDGQEVPIADSAAPIRDRAGQLKGAVLVFRDVTLERQAKRLLQEHNAVLEQHVQERTAQLQESEDHLHSVMNAVPALIAFVDAGQRYVYVNEQYQRRFAPTHPSLTGLGVEEVLGTERYATAAPLIEQVLAGEPQSYDWQPFPGVWQAIRYLPRRAEDGQVSGYYVLGTDITQRKLAEEKIQALNSELDLRVRELERVSRALRTLSTGNRTMLRASDEPQLLENMCKAIVLAGGYGMAIVWYKSQATTPGTALALEPMAECGAPGGIAMLRDMGAALTDEEIEKGITAQAIRSGGVRRVRDRRTDPNYVPWSGWLSGFSSGIAFPLQVNGSIIGALSIYDQEPDTFGDDVIDLLTDFAEDLAFGVATLRTSGERERAQTELARMLRHDTLTGLLNAVGFSQALTEALDDSAHSAKRWAAYQFNIERLGEVNDVLGFAQGDQILQDFGRRLRDSAPAGAVVARLRGDEFGVLAAADGAQQAEHIAEALEHTLSQPFSVGDIELGVSAKVGISLCPEHGTNAQELLRGMGKALYQARTRGVSRCFFDPAQQRDQTERLKMAGELKRAIENQQLRLYLQPKVSFSSQRVCGSEALVRWQHPKNGLILPGAFIGLAEQTGLIKPLTEWLIVTVLDHLQRWQAEGTALPVAINLSSRNFRDEQLYSKFRRWQAERAVAPGLLEIEITESTMMEDPEHALRVLHALREDGVPLYVDDFGTGYSSLSYLQKLPFDYIKIDQSFVSALPDSRDSAMIVRSTIDLVHDLGRKTVAEGVETERHWRQLMALGCDIAQGYLIARPMPADEFPHWLAGYKGLGIEP